MTETPPEGETRRIQFLLTNAIILGLFILTLVFLVSAYPILLAPEPTVTPTITLPLRPSTIPTLTPTITQTPTVTRTLRPTFTPTITPTPTVTPTSTETPSPTGPPTLTPAIPVGGEEQYGLIEWSPEEADRLATLLEYYPNTLPARARGEDDTAYYAAYRYGVFALREALLRFPDAPQAESWRWRLAYMLSAQGDLQAPELYADRIAAALNRGETTVAGLHAWFQAQDPRLSLYTIDLEPPSGYLSSRLVELRGRGSAFLWLLEGTGSFEIFPLVNGFDFLGGSEADSLVSDLTGDGIEETVLSFSAPPGVFTLRVPRIFDLSTVPARELPFRPSDAVFEIGMDYQTEWAVVQNTSGQNDLQFQGRAFPACPVTLKHTYRWSGEWFERVEASYPAEPDLTTLSFCRYLVDHATAVWGPEAAAQILETTLPDWPPALDEEGNPYPDDAKDEWHYRLGISQALAGDFEGARQTLAGIVNSPSTPLSRWKGQAQTFLGAYIHPEDLYRACVGAEFCRPADAIRTLLAALPPSGALDPIQYLWQSGLAPRASGYYDFDGDGETERWFTVRHRPLEQLEFWILAPYSGGFWPLLVGLTDENRPTLTAREGDLRTNNAAEAQGQAIQLGADTVFALRRDPGSGQPYLVRFPAGYQWPNRFFLALEELQERLFSGEDPRDIQQALRDLEEFPGLVCNWTCDPYIYLLGLASELSGDETSAVSAYLELWWNYSRSPYTMLARPKLRGPAVIPTGTIRTTSAATATPGATPTPTISGTPQTTMPTLTSTPTPTITETATSNP